MTHDSNPLIQDQSSPRLWLVLSAAACAGGMGWGIRGQYGHETGAMLAGVLVGLVLVHLLTPRATSLAAARAVAFCALGVSVGGSMTYGQTIGLTQDAALVGNWEALRWGMLGLAIIGGLWISFAGALLGMGLGERTYRPLELAAVVIVMLGCFLIGTHLLNKPFDPASQQLPKFYFSDDWHWKPGAALKPRPECWGGLLFALAALVAYVGFIRKDQLAVRLATWGLVGGAIGFPGGQCLQAYHAWNAESFRQGWFATLEPHMNWWNCMETTFGAVWAAVLALGLWLNRHRIGAEQREPTIVLRESGEWILVAIHLPLLVTWNFAEISAVDLFADNALSMIAIPLVAVVGGRLWPYLVALPIVALPIAGKTVRQLSYEETTVSPVAGYAIYLVFPLLVATVTALWLARQPASRPSSRTFSRWALVVATWLYFGLNFGFFHFPWPWEAWTSRTPNGIVYTVCAVVLTLVALRAVPAGATAQRQGT